MFGLGKVSVESLMDSLPPAQPLAPEPQSRSANIQEAIQSGERSFGIEELSDFFQYGDGWGYGVHNGEKFEGDTGFGGNSFLFIDYWGLRAKSSELFERVLYARGIIRRLVTNIVVTGLSLESTPAESMLGMKEGTLDDWTDLTEEGFELWANDPKLCDFEGRRTFGELQREAKREALVTGDILVVQRINKRLKVPQVQLIDGNLVQTPINYDPLTSTNRIEYGVELDQHDRHVAYWVTQEDGSSKRLAAYGPKSGRKMAWLYYGSDKRMTQVRGQPILSLILQSLKEMDRFRDSAQRKAVVNAMIALFVTKDGDGVGTRPVAAGATRRTAGTTPGKAARARHRSRLRASIQGLQLTDLHRVNRSKVSRTREPIRAIQTLKRGSFKGSHGR